MNKKRSRDKNILELAKRLLDFIQSFKRISLFFIFVDLEQARQRRSYLRINNDT